jgi:hypothetical protein
VTDGLEVLAARNTGLIIQAKNWFNGPLTLAAKAGDQGRPAGLRARVFEAMLRSPR